MGEKKKKKRKKKKKEVDQTIPHELVHLNEDADIL